MSTDLTISSINTCNYGIDLSSLEHTSELCDCSDNFLCNFCSSQPRESKSINVKSQMSIYFDVNDLFSNKLIEIFNHKNFFCSKKIKSKILSLFKDYNTICAIWTPWYCLNLENFENMALQEIADYFAIMMETLFVWCISEQIEAAMVFQKILKMNKMFKILSSIMYNNISNGFINKIITNNTLYNNSYIVRFFSYHLSDPLSIICKFLKFKDIAKIRCVCKFFAISLGCTNTSKWKGIKFGSINADQIYHYSPHDFENNVHQMLESRKFLVYEGSYYRIQNIVTNHGLNYLRDIDLLQ